MSDLKQTLIAALEAHHIAGASIALWHDGEMEVATAGYANAAEHIEVTPNTVFQVGSITKAFTALLMGVLVDEGLVDFDAPVATYLPDLRIDNVAIPESLTVRTLLDHSCGFEGDFFADFGPDPDSLKRYVEACTDLRWLHAPGQMQSYNSAAYCIAARLIETVTGEYFNEALTQRVLAALGMERFCFFDHEVARYRAAVGHRWSPAEQGFQVSENLRLPHCMSASGASLTMSAPDLLRFGRLFLDGGRAQSGEQLISMANIQEMTQPRVFTPPHNKPLLMSWAILETPKGPLLATSGQTIDQNAMLVLSLEHGFAVAALTNGTGAANVLLETVLMPWMADAYGISFEPPAPQKASGTLSAGDQSVDLSRYAGEYVNQTRCRVTHVADGLHLEMIAKSTTGEGEERETARLDQKDGQTFTMLIGDPPQPVGQVMFFGADSASEKPQFLAMSNRLHKRL